MNEVLKVSEAVATRARPTNICLGQARRTSLTGHWATAPLRWTARKRGVSSSRNLRYSPTIPTGNAARNARRQAQASSMACGSSQASRVAVPVAAASPSARVAQIQPPYHPRRWTGAYSTTNAAAAIAAAAEQDGTHGPEDEGGGEHREGCQQVSVPIPAGEIGDREDRGEGAVEREVIPLDGVADAGRNQRPLRARPVGHRATWRLPTATAQAVLHSHDPPNDRTVDLDQPKHGSGEATPRRKRQEDEYVAASTSHPLRVRAGRHC